MKNNQAKKDWTFYLAIFMSLSLAIGLLYFVVLMDYIYALACFGISALFFGFMIVPMLVNYRRKRHLEHENYRFISAFSVSLSTTGSLEEAYEMAMEGSGEELKEISDSLSDRSIEERLEYLGTFFHSDTYSMFLSVYEFYTVQGGEFLKCASSLLKECSRQEEANNSKERDSKRVLREFIVLWCMAAFILAFMRFAMSAFYDQMTAMFTFKISTLSVLPVAYLSCYFFFRVYTGCKGIEFKRRKQE